MKATNGNDRRWYPQFPGVAVHPLVFKDKHLLLVKRAKRLGHYNLHLAENIVGAGYRLDNDDAFLSWSGSPGHNANMLGASYKYTGYAIGGGYAVQLFTEYPTVNGEPQLPPGWYWDD